MITIIAVLASTGTAAATTGAPITPTGDWSTNVCGNGAPARAYLDNNGLVHLAGGSSKRRPDRT